MASTLIAVGDTRADKAAKLCRIMNDWNLSNQDRTYLLAAAHGLFQPRHFLRWAEKTMNSGGSGFDSVEFVISVLVSIPMRKTKTLSLRLPW